MSVLRKALRYTTKAELIVLVSCICFCLSVLVFNIVPLIIHDVLLLSCASVMTIYSVFYSKAKDKMTIANRLIGAMFAGAFVWQLIEASSKLFAKWAVWRFF